jgi:sec-independent protein translocase protein TatA
MIGLHTLAWAFDPWTYLLVALLALLLFGKRLPEVGRSLGRGIAEFKRGLHDVQDEVLRDDQERDTAKPKLRSPESAAEEAARKRLPADESGVEPPEDRSEKPG